MTLFWIVAALITAGVVAALVRPLQRPLAPASPRGDGDIEVYRDQLAEVGLDVERGVMDGPEAEATRTEISRRILAAAGRDAAALVVPQRRPSQVTTLVLISAIPLAALTLYLAIGRPDMRDHPFTALTAEAAKPVSPPQKVVDAVNHLAERLKAEPGDLDGWMLLGQSYGKLGRLAEAVGAWRKAVALAPDQLEISSNLAEALVTANQGLVPDEARTLFEAQKSKMPDDPRSSHYLALARFQAGDEKGALDRWAALVAVSPANAPWLGMVRQHIAEVAGRLNLNPAEVTPQPLAAKPADSAAADQAKTIRAMVDGLRAKLQTAPADIDGWLRLIRAYEVLGDAPARLEAARHAREQAPRQPDVLLALAEAVIAATPATGPTDRLPPEAGAVLREVLAVAPDTAAALWYLGLDAALAGNVAEARPLLEKLLTLIEPASAEYQEVKTRLESLK